MVRFFQLIFIVLLVATELSAGLWLGPATPHLLLAVLLATVLVGDWPTSWWYMVGGFLLDALSATLPGFHVLLLATFGWLLHFLHRQVFSRPDPLIAWSVFFVFSLGYEVISSLLVGQFGWLVFASAITTSVVAMITYGVLLRWGAGREAVRLA